ncbi:extracellular solute-binding protein, partial [Pseudorhodobacter sp.]
MMKLLSLTTALTTFAFAASAQEVVVMSWGGAYGKSQNEAYLKPYTEKTGVKMTMVDTDNPATPVKAMVQANNVTVDVVDLEYADALRLCDEGLLERLDTSILSPAPDGTAAADDFLPGAITDCFVATIVFSTMFAYDSTKFPDGPTRISDFFDLEKFPGKRGLRKVAKVNLEMALM